MYHREIETIRSRIQDEMPELTKELNKDQIDQMLGRYNDQMQGEVENAINKNRAKLESLDYLEKVRKMEAIARMTKEIYQNQYLQEIRAKYQPVSESLDE